MTSEGRSREEQGTGHGGEKPLCVPNNLRPWPWFQELIAPEITERWTSNSGSPALVMVLKKLFLDLWRGWLELSEVFQNLERCAQRKKRKNFHGTICLQISRYKKMQDTLRKRCKWTTGTFYKVIGLIILWEWLFQAKPDTFLLCLQMELNF